MARRLSSIPPQKPSAGKCVVAVKPDTYNALRGLAILRNTTFDGLISQLLSR